MEIEKKGDMHKHIKQGNIKAKIMLLSKLNKSKQMNMN